MHLTREQILAEMGITPIWRLRSPGTGGTEAGTAPDRAPEAGISSPDRAAAMADAPASQAAAAGALPAQAMPIGTLPGGIAAAGTFPIQAAGPLPPPVPRAAEEPGWREARAAAGDCPGNAPQPASASSRTEIIAGLDWDGLKTSSAACRACRLCEQRKQAVLGVGDVEADWLFIGEGPGAEEDIQGEPFVGQAGKLLDAMLAAIDLKRGNNVYIANAVKCRPPGNRTPAAEEMAACRPYLERQIELIRPRLIVLLGRAAVSTLLHDDHPLGSLRGKRFQYQGIPVIVTYHPAYLLRNLPEKAKAWEDLVFARRLMRELERRPEAGPA